MTRRILPEANDFRQNVGIFLTPDLSPGIVGPHITLIAKGRSFKMNIVQIADKVLDAINTLLEYLMGILMMVLVTIVFMEVVRRYVFNDPTHWASESCRFLLIWITFTGASIVTRLSAHLTMGFTIHRFVNKPLSKFIKIFIAAAVSIVMIVITYYSAKVTLLAGYRSAPMTGMPMYIPWSALPINATIMSIYMIAETIKMIFGKVEEREEVVA